MMKVVMSICAVAALAGWMWARGHDLRTSPGGQIQPHTRLNQEGAAADNTGRAGIGAAQLGARRSDVESVRFSPEQPDDKQNDGRGNEESPAEGHGRG